MWLRDCRQSFSIMIREKQTRDAAAAKKEVSMSPLVTPAFLCRRAAATRQRRSLPAAGTSLVPACSQPSRDGGEGFKLHLACTAWHLSFEAMIIFSSIVVKRNDSSQSTCLSPAMQEAKAAAQPDELIDFHHLKARRGMSQLEIEDEVQTDLQRATGLADTDLGQASHLHRVLQLTGGLSTGVERGKTAQLTQRPPWVG